MWHGHSNSKTSKPPLLSLKARQLKRKTWFSSFLLRVSRKHCAVCVSMHIPSLVAMNKTSWSMLLKSSTYRKLKIAK